MDDSCQVPGFMYLDANCGRSIHRKMGAFTNEARDQQAAYLIVSENVFAIQKWRLPIPHCIFQHRGIL